MSASNQQTEIARALQLLNSIGHAPPMSPQHVRTASVMPSAVPVISSPNAISDNPWSRTPVLYYDSPCNPPALDDLGDISLRSGSLATEGSAFQTHNLDDHTSYFPISSESQYAVPHNDHAAYFSVSSESQYAVPNNHTSYFPLSYESRYTVPDNYHTSYFPLSSESQYAEPEFEMFTHNPSSYSSSSQRQDFVIPQPPPSHPQESSLIPIPNRPSSPLVICRWLYNGGLCGHETTLEEYKQHWKLNHFYECRDALIQCRWQDCDYHKQGDPSIRVMLRGCMWRHVNEVHLGHWRST